MEWKSLNILIEFHARNIPAKFYNIGPVVSEMSFEGNGGLTDRRTDGRNAIPINPCRRVTAFI
jgi:hypothetical protein